MSKDEALIACGPGSDSGTISVVGGPFCGAKWDFSAVGQQCIAIIRTEGVSYEWYSLVTHGRIENGSPVYMDRWVYLGRGTGGRPPELMK